MFFTLTMSDTEATDIIAPLISYLGFTDRPKKIQKTEEMFYVDRDSIASISWFGFSLQWST